MDEKGLDVDLQKVVLSEKCFNKVRRIQKGCFK
ncbi:hypothetical protein KKC_05377 [Listeria fleischmannii subsp. coloradonensis]|nr:hypothetical protein KKC_05377 [Listeria fleischmannii subsp. coloradonensis]